MSQFFPGGHSSSTLECCSCSLEEVEVGVDVDVVVDGDNNVEERFIISIAEQNTRGLISAPTRATWIVPTEHREQAISTVMPMLLSCTKLQ